MEISESNNIQTCVFCKLATNSKNNFILESEHSFMIFDIYPKTEGHSLIITKKHFKNLSETEDQDLMDAILLVKKGVNFLLKKYPNIKGFNYISNHNKIANQVIFHTHIHIIPRY